MPAGPANRHVPDVRTRLWRLALALLGLNVCAWVAAAWVVSLEPLAAGLAGLAWVLGARHAFDIDHIAAIDNVTRTLRGRGGRPVSVGFFFALGHSSVVLVLTLLLALSTRLIEPRLAQFGHFGDVAGTVASAGFLTLIGLLNLPLLSALFAARRKTAGGRGLEPPGTDGLLEQRGLISRLLRPVLRRIDGSAKMFPVGVLFGLGFDTATEVAILGIAATLGADSTLPLWAIVTFPLLFMGGMTLMDSVNGILMSRAYGWAMDDPSRRLSFNLTLTSMSVLLALGIAAVEWVRLLGPALGLRGTMWQWLPDFPSSHAGLLAAGALMVIWLIALAVSTLPRAGQPSSSGQ